MFTNIFLKFCWLEFTTSSVENCASKVSRKKLDPKNTVENISDLKVRQLSINPIKYNNWGQFLKTTDF